jgi:hypothetical protein
MKQLTREQAIQLLNTDDVYNSLELEDFYDEENERYVSMYDILYTLGVSAEEIEEAMANK